MKNREKNSEKNVKLTTLGFTLVELLAVIVVLTFIILFSVPTMSKTIKNNDETKYQKFLENIYMAAENYIYISDSKFTILKNDNGKAFISIGELIKQGYLSLNTVNPKNDTPIANDTILITKDFNGLLQYEYIEGNYSNYGYVQDGLILNYDGYRLSEGDTIKDYSFHHHDGKMYNFNIQEQNGIQFDGVDDYIEVLNLSQLDYGQQFTFSFVLHPTDVSNYRGIIGLHGTRGYHGVTIQFNENNIDAGYGTGSNWQTCLLSNASTYLNNTIQLTVAFDIGNKTEIYINGVLLQEAEVVSDLIGQDEVNIGRSLISYDRYFKGTMYDIQIYDRILTQEEISNNFNVAKKRFDING